MEVPILVYLNPSIDTLTIELLNSIAWDENDIQLFDLSGKLVYSSIFEGASLTISTRDYSLGTYVLNVVRPKREFEKAFCFSIGVQY